MDRSRRTLITGATGFIGSHVAAAYARAGHSVRCGVRRTSDRRWVRDLDVEWVQMDLRNPTGVGDALRNVHTVVHVGGITRARTEKAYGEINTRGTVELARRAAARGVRRFVFISTLAARGPDAAAGPASAYGRSKRDAEEALHALSGSMTVIVLRPGGVYGPRDREFLPLFRLAARGWLPVPLTEMPLQPVYVEDLAAAVLAAGEVGRSFGPYAVMGRERYSWDDVAAALEAALGRGVRRVPIPNALYVAAGAIADALVTLGGREPRFDRRRAEDLARYRWTADPSATIVELGWHPRTTLHEGFRRTAAWYRREGWIPRGPTQVTESIADLGRRRTGGAESGERGAVRETEKESAV